MGDLACLLVAPETCQATLLPFGDKRKGGIWHCPHGRKIIGKGKARPDCLCKLALDATLRALAASGEAQ